METLSLIKPRVDAIYSGIGVNEAQIREIDTLLGPKIASLIASTGLTNAQAQQVLAITPEEVNRLRATVGLTDAQINALQQRLGPDIAQTYAQTRLLNTQSMLQDMLAGEYINVPSGIPGQTGRMRIKDFADFLAGAGRGSGRDARTQLAFDKYQTALGEAEEARLAKAKTAEAEIHKLRGGGESFTFADDFNLRSADTYVYLSAEPGARVKKYDIPEIAGVRKTARELYREALANRMSLSDYLREQLARLGMTLEDIEEE